MDKGDKILLTENKQSIEHMVTSLFSPQDITDRLDIIKWFVWSGKASQEDNLNHVTLNPNQICCHPV